MKKKSVRIKSKFVFEYILLASYVFYVFFAHWIWFGRGIQETFLIIVSFVIMVKNLNKYRLNSDILYAITAGIILFCVCIIGIIIKTEQKYLLQNFKSMFGTLLVTIGIVCSFKILRSDGIDIFKFLYKYLNIFFLINNIIILFQSFIPYFFMNRLAINSVGNNFYEDQLTGFFGIFGTTRWDVWSIFIIIVNFYIAYIGKQRKVVIYNIILIGFSMFIAVLSSTRAFFILMPIMVFTFIFFICRFNFLDRIKQIFVLIAVVGIVFIAYLLNPRINEFVNQLISDKLAMYLKFDLGYLVAANDDRGRAVHYALLNGGLFGVGIGTIGMYASLDYAKYMGINSMSIYIYLIGIIGFILWTYILTQLVVRKNKSKFNFKVGTFLLLLIFSYFLPIYSNIALLPAVILIIYVYSLVLDRSL